MILALNHWFRQKNEGSKKSVPKNFKTAVTLVLKNTKKKNNDSKYEIRFKIGYGKVLISAEKQTDGQGDLLCRYDSYQQIR